MLCIFPLTTYASGQEMLYKKYSKMSSDYLYNMGHRLFEVQNKPEESIICYSIITSRYSENMSDKEKILCANAYLSEWGVYFFNFYDMTKLFDLLSKAKDIYEEAHGTSSFLYLDYGVLFQTIYEQTKYKDYAINAIKYYKKAYDVSIATKHANDNSIDVIISNLITVSYSVGKLNNMKHIISEYSANHKLGSDKILKMYNIHTYYGMLACTQKKYDEALKYFQFAIDKIPNDPNYIRYLYLAHFNRASVYASMGDYRKAIQFMAVPMRIANANDMKDVKVELYNNLSNYYKGLGDDKTSMMYTRMYYQLKDSIVNFQQAARVSEIRFTNKINKLEAQQVQMAQNRVIMNIIICIIILIAVIILVSFIIVKNRNKQLRQRNQTLYEKNVIMLNTENENRQRMKNYKEHIRMLEQQQSAQTISDEEKSADKFKQSELDDDYINNVAERITEVMENSDEVFTPKFSVQMLADIIEVKYKTVSEVIHQKFGCNFNAFVNGYRIREACKRINDTENYGKYSIDGIMQSVGFKSRATFISSFKKFTGLKPSEYQQIAKEKDKQ
jgi:AraC-like DNA-binding protein